MGRERVVILGAGVAGLTAAHELLERGFEVVIVDSRPAPGGKARSYRARSWRAGTNEEQDRSLPGEHGFRFFPGFYRHLDATMKKILLVPGDERGGRVIDNLVPIQEELLAVTGKPAIRVPAAAPGGPRLVDAFRSILQFPKDLLNVGLTREDLELFADKIWQFATSCPQRRDTEYEMLGWRQFVQSLDRSDEYYWYLASGLTRVLVAAKARKASTKTIGNVGLQLLLCMTERDNTTDRVLNGPTNDVWFEPWVAHLRHLARDKGVGFEYRSSTVVTGLRVTRGRVESIALAGRGAGELSGFTQVICALPAEVLAELIATDEGLRKAGGPQLEGVLTLGRRPRPGDPSETFLERMTGMQVYLKRDVPISRGHQIFPDTPWSLTSISQRQFWQRDRLEEWLPGGMGVLSIDISSWDLPGLGDIPAAQECDLPGIYHGTLRQIRDALGGRDLSDANIAGWHLDGVTGNRPNPDLERILVNHVGSAALRPTAATAISNLFLAGDYVKTKTDLACMEGANESARHAVNGLLAAAGHPDDDRCETFDPVENEPRVLQYLQQMDEYRFKRGLPWGGVSLGDWLVRAGWAADAVGDVLLADDKGDTSTIPRPPAPDGATDAPVAAGPGPYRRPRHEWVRDLTGKDGTANEDRCRHAVAHAVARARPVSSDVLPKAFAAPGRTDPMFLRWPLYEIRVEEGGRADDYIIPFIVYDADAIIVHGHATRFEFLEHWTRNTGGDYHPVFCLKDGKKLGYAELWMVRYHDTVGGPYDEIVINFVVSRRPGREYRWRTPYSSIVPMMDPGNRLFTIRLLVDERLTPPPNQGPIKFGNELFGTDKRRERIRFLHEKDRRQVSVVEKGVETLQMNVDFAESAVQDLTDYLELAREIGLVETMRNARQAWRGDVLHGGLVTPDFRLPRNGAGTPPRTIEILAAYRFSPKLSVSAATALKVERNAPRDSFAAILNEMGFAPQIAALDSHLKSVLYLEDWPRPGRSTDAELPRTGASPDPAATPSWPSANPAARPGPARSASEGQPPAAGKAVRRPNAARRGRPPSKRRP